MTKIKDKKGEGNDKIVDAKFSEGFSHCCDKWKTMGI